MMYRWKKKIDDDVGTVSDQRNEKRISIKKNNAGVTRMKNTSNGIVTNFVLDTILMK